MLYNTPLLLLLPLLNHFGRVQLCDPIPEILQARTLEWFAISFSNIPLGLLCKWKFIHFSNIPLGLLYKWKFIHFGGAGANWLACRTSQTRGWTCALRGGSAVLTTGPPGKSEDVCTFWLPSTSSPCSHCLHPVTKSLMFFLWVCFWNTIVLQHYVNSCWSTLT